MDKHKAYNELLNQYKGLLDPEINWVGNYANFCASVQRQFNHWWCGFYMVNREKNRLELGPFQGPVACTFIEKNKGVCGTSWARAETVVVPDVHVFDGHIACSAESNSEIVVPIIRNGEVVGVLDIDSIFFDTFDETDKKYLEELVQLLPEPY